MILWSTSPIVAHETQHINTQNGLIGDNVQEIFTDSKGLTWIGTNEGVCCYNGADIVYFEPVQSGAKRSVGHIIEMADGKILLGTRGGLCRLDIENQCYNVINAEVGIVNALCIVNDTLIIGSRNGLWIYHTDTHLENIALEGTVVSRENAINAMVTDGKDGVWICTNERLIHVTLPTRTIRKYDIPPQLLNGNIRTLCRIGTTLYIGPHTGRLFSFNCLSEAFSLCPGYDLENIISLNTDGSSLYVGTNGNGAYLIDPQQGLIVEHWHTAATEHQLPDNTVNIFAHDMRLGINWWGLYPSGMMHELHKQPLFESYTFREFDSRKHAIRCFAIHDSERLIGTPEGIWHINEAHGIVRHFDRKLFGDNNINDIIRFGEKYLIAAKGISVYDPQKSTLEILTGDEVVERGIFNNFCLIGKNDELLASSDLGLVRIDSQLQIKQVFTTFNSRLPEAYPVAIFSDGEGKSWIGTTSQLCIFDEQTGQIQSDHFPTSFFDQALSLHFAQAIDGDVIAHTEQEIYKCKTDLSSYQKWDMKDKLAGAMIMMIAPYKEGYWIGTNMGLLLCDEDFNPIERFDKSDGLHHLKISGKEYVNSPDGTLWIAMERGIARLTPTQQEQLHQNKPSKVIMRRVKTNGNEWDEREVISLARSEQKIHIRWNFGTGTTLVEPILLDYAEQRGRHYEWSLNEKEYVSTKGKATINIGSLCPGRHKLRVRMLGHEETASDFILIVFPSATFWLEIALTMALVCTIVISYKYRRRKRQLKALLRQKHQLELRIAAKQAVEAHKQEEVQRISALEEERKQAMQERSQRSCELHRTLAHQVRTYMDESKAYRNPTLKVADVATAVGTSTTNISEMCSMYLGTSFFAFINSYRIEEFKTMVHTEKYANFTITALAEMCGFKKSSFFNVFKEHEGCTPAAWLRKEGIRRNS